MNHFLGGLLATLALSTVTSAASADTDSGFASAYGPHYAPPVPQHFGQSLRPHRSDPSVAGQLRDWNTIAINASGLDHTPVSPGESRLFGEQLGPHRASRAMAIVHIAMFDAINAIEGDYESYTGIAPAPRHTAPEAAIVQAAHDTLVEMFPSQQHTFDALLAEDLAALRDGAGKRNGVEVGKRAAAAILAMRAHDGSHHVEARMGGDYIPATTPGTWRQDPVSLVPLAMGSRWNEVTPFVIPAAASFRAPPPPAMASAAYRIAFDEVKRLGGDGIITPTMRTAEQTLIGNFWAYDGTPSLCAPPRLYNQIARQIAEQRNIGAVQLARLLALVNVAMAEAGIAIWDAKYAYKFWRPITGIRESDPGTGPTGLGDGNAATLGDPLFSPLGAPASNLTGPNFTPPFPAYPSGHAGFGGALFQSLRMFFHTDHIRFTFVSDEYNGQTRDNHGAVRPLIPRHFARLSDAEEENGQSRIYLGIHWAFDKTEGIAMGRSIAHYVFTHAFRPVRERDDD